MAGDKKHDNNKEVKVYFLPSEINEIDSFRKDWTRTRSRNELFHLAIEYYMTKLRSSKGATDKKGFPLDVAAETQEPYETREPTRHKKQGSGHS